MMVAIEQSYADRVVAERLRELAQAFGGEGLFVTTILGLLGVLDETQAIKAINWIYPALNAELYLSTLSSLSVTCTIAPASFEICEDIQSVLLGLALKHLGRKPLLESVAGIHERLLNSNEQDSKETPSPVLEYRNRICRCLERPVRTAHELLQDVPKLRSTGKGLAWLRSAADVALAVAPEFPLSLLEAAQTREGSSGGPRGEEIGLCGKSEGALVSEALLRIQVTTEPNLKLPERALESRRYVHSSRAWYWNVLGCGEESTAQDAYLDWQLRDWHDIYESVRLSCIRTLFHEKPALLPQILAIDNTNLRYRMEDIEVTSLKTPFSPPKMVVNLTDRVASEYLRTLEEQGRYTNGTNLRLAGFYRKGHHLCFNVQRVQYEHYVRTNLVLDAKQGDSRTLRELLHSAQQAPEALCDSSLADNLGVNILIFSSEGSLAVPQRYGQIAFRENQLCPAISTTMPRESVSPVGSSLLVEALHADRIWVEFPVPTPARDRTLFLGATRELIRGGEPELFFVLHSELDEKELQAAWMASQSRQSRALRFLRIGWRAVYPLLAREDRVRLLERIQAFTYEQGTNAGVTLLAGLSLWLTFRLRHSYENLREL